MGKDNEPRTMKTVETSLEIVEALIDLDKAGVTTLAEHLDIAKTTVYTHLATLRKHQFVKKVDDKYQLSLKYYRYGMYCRNRNKLFMAANPEIHELATETKEYAHLLIEEFGRGVYLDLVKGDRGIDDTYHLEGLEAGEYLHVSAAGKAYLAELPERRIDEIIAEHGLPRFTKCTITTREELIDDLETIRERGYSLNDQEQVLKARSVGAAIQTNDGEPVGAISVSGPIKRLTEDRIKNEIGEKVMEKANLIELNINTKTDL